MSDDGHTVTPKVGDTVRVEYTGKVKRPAAGSDYLTVHADHDGASYCPHISFVTIIEPEYEPDAMYVDADGSYFIFWPDVDPDRPWFAPGADTGCDESFPVRPLRKLVPES